MTFSSECVGVVPHCAVNNNPVTIRLVFVLHGRIYRLSRPSILV